MAATPAITAIAASDVAVAARSSYGSQNISSGTITAPPPTPNSPLNRPARVPIAISFSARRDRSSETECTSWQVGHNARHTRPVSPAATLVEALEPIRSEPDNAAVLLDIDGTLAPIVRHAADAHVPEATRSLLIAIANRYRLVGCVSGRRATTARQIVAIGTIAYVGNHGGEL